MLNGERRVLEALLSEQVGRFEEVEEQISVPRVIAVSAMAADACELRRGLIEKQDVALMGFGYGIISRDGDIDRGVDRDVDIDHGAAEMTVAASARHCDGIGPDQAQERRI